MFWVVGMKINERIIVLLMKRKLRLSQVIEKKEDLIEKYFSGIFL